MNHLRLQDSRGRNVLDSVHGSRVSSHFSAGDSYLLSGYFYYHQNFVRRFSNCWTLLRLRMSIGAFSFDSKSSTAVIVTRSTREITKERWKESNRIPRVPGIIRPKAGFKSYSHQLPKNAKIFLRPTFYGRIHCCLTLWHGCTIY